MKIEISKNTLELIIGHLKNGDHLCDWELAALPPQHKMNNTVTYQYWVCRQIAIRNALKELNGQTDNCF